LKNVRDIVLLLGIFRRVPCPAATLVPFYFPGGALPLNKRPNSPKFSALHDQISQRNSKKMYTTEVIVIYNVPGYNVINVYEFNSALEELNKNAKKY
jgi:hypothetical protein